MQIVKSESTSHTKMSLNERFTLLRNNAPASVPRRGGFRGGGRSTASAKNRRLALQMAQRPSVVAALSRNNILDDTPRLRNLLNVTGNRRGRLLGLSPIQKRNFKRRNFQSTGRLTRSQSLQSLNIQSPSAQSRLGFRANRGRPKRGGLTRSNSQQRLTRSASLQSLNFNGNSRGQPMKRGFGNRGGLSFRGGPSQRGIVKKGRGNLRGNTRGNLRGNTRGNLRGSNRGNLRGIARGNQRGGKFNNVRNQNNRPNNRGRGNFRSRGRGGRQNANRGRQNNTLPSKETLDQELDQYMSSSRSHLDRELDSYMNQTEENWG